ncbi:protein kinase domain-containing protein [Pseudonocardia bannensis]|uniref:serine/threonine-protein kinase n=1 Tax=Pseudonocardia bannensis TaxID=630973 RepID=UPI001B7CF982|nr:serine/threonine-protein kinase [Pseudonocardia bannensis]
MTADDDVRTGGDPPVLAGRYVLGAVIGIGASAEVHRAWDRVTCRAVAVKLFPARASLRDRRRQQQEMYTLARLHHPGLVVLHDGGVEDGRAFVVTDLVEGRTLSERIAEGPLPPDVVRELGARLADALAHVHADGIVHRDVKPGNVLLGHDGRPRLADFGIARALDETAVTETGLVVGTAAYLAPEQVRGVVVGPAADVYALGLVLLEALKGRREYQGSAVESALARLHRAPEVPDGIPAELAAVLRAMTATEPARRPSAAAVAETLNAPPARARALVGGPAPVGAPVAGPPTAGLRRPPRSRLARRPARVALAGLMPALLAGVVAAMVTAGTPGASPAPVEAAVPAAAPRDPGPIPAAVPGRVAPTPVTVAGPPVPAEPERAPAAVLVHAPTGDVVGDDAPGSAAVETADPIRTSDRGRSDGGTGPRAGRDGHEAVDPPIENPRPDPDPDADPDAPPADPTGQPAPSTEDESPPGTQDPDASRGDGAEDDA